MHKCTSFNIIHSSWEFEIALNLNVSSIHRILIHTENVNAILMNTIHPDRTKKDNNTNIPCQNVFFETFLFTVPRSEKYQRWLRTSLPASAWKYNLWKWKHSYFSWKVEYVLALKMSILHPTCKQQWEFVILFLMQMNMLRTHVTHF